MLQAKVVEKIKTHILCLVTILKHSFCLWDNMENYVRAKQATDDSIIWCLHFTCWIT